MPHKRSAGSLAPAKLAPSVRMRSLRAKRSSRDSLRTRQLWAHGKGLASVFDLVCACVKTRARKGRGLMKAHSFAFLAGKARASTPVSRCSQPPLVVGGPQLCPERHDSRYAQPVATFPRGATSVTPEIITGLPSNITSQLL